MTSDKEYVVLILFLSVWVVLFVYVQLLSPLLIRRKFSRVLASRGWVAVDAEREPAWNDIMKLAVEEHRGAASVREYENKYGPLTINGKISEKRSGRALEIYRDAGTTHYRYAAIGKKIEDIDASASSLLANKDRHRYTGREVWIGEARRIPVERPVMVFSGFAAMFGSGIRKMADRHGVDPETIPAVTSPPESNPVQAVRGILLENSLAAEVMANIYLGPRAWVMTVPLKRLGSRTVKLLDLAKRVSEAVDRLSA